MSQTRICISGAEGLCPTASCVASQAKGSVGSGWQLGDTLAPQWTCQDAPSSSGPSATYLHAADADAQAGRCALSTLPHVTGLLLLGHIVPVLPGPHLQVKDTGVLVL